MARLVNAVMKVVLMTNADHKSLTTNVVIKMMMRKRMKRDQKKKKRESPKKDLDTKRERSRSLRKKKSNMMKKARNLLKLKIDVLKTGNPPKKILGEMVLSLPRGVHKSHLRMKAKNLPREMTAKGLPRGMRNFLRKMNSINPLLKRKPNVKKPMSREKITTMKKRRMREREDLILVKMARLLVKIRKNSFDSISDFLFIKRSITL